MTTVDGFAHEAHFLDHIAPVLLELDPELRGTIYTGKGWNLPERAAGLGLDAQPRRAPSKIGDPPALVASYGDLRRADPRPVFFMEHGSGQTYGTLHRSYAGGPGRRHVRAFLCPNDRVAHANRRKWSGKRIEVIGSPRLDPWHDGRRPLPANTTPTVAVSFHWDCTVVPETRSAYPHYRLALEALAELNRSGDVHIIGHGHPRIFELLRPRWLELDIEPVETFDEVLARADLYVVDNSSTLFEFAAATPDPAGRPVLVLNAPYYRRNVNHGLRFWSEADVGINIDGPDELIPGIRRALEDPAEVRANRLRVIDTVYPQRDGLAARRAATIIREELDPMPIMSSAKVKTPAPRQGRLEVYEDPRTGATYKVNAAEATRRGLVRHKKRPAPEAPVAPEPAPTPAKAEPEPEPEPVDELEDDNAYEAAPDYPHDGTRDDVLDWVDDDPLRAAIALDRELDRDKPRTTLVVRLEELGATTEDG